MLGCPCLPAIQAERQQILGGAIVIDRVHFGSLTFEITGLEPHEDFISP